MTALAPTNGILIYNGSGSLIPPRSAVVVSSMTTDAATSAMDATTYATVGQYSGGPGVILITGPETIRSATKGRAYLDELIYVSIDDSISDPIAGEEWGPVPGAWTISRGGAGFICMGYSANGATVKRAMFLRRSPRWYWGKTASAVTAGSLASPTTYTANIWLPTSATVGGAFAVATQAGFLGITVQNRDPSFATSTVGLTGRFEWAFNEWTGLVGCG